MTPVKVPLVDNIFLLPPPLIKPPSKQSNIMRFQTSLLSLLLLALVLAPYVDASAKKKKKEG